MSRTAKDDAEEQDIRQLLDALDKVEPWIAVVGSGERPSGIWTPQPRSALSTDDKRTHPYQVSHRVWMALTAAMDFLHCLKGSLLLSVTKGQIDIQLHTYAQTTLLRGAIENAAIAVCLLAPSREERVTTRLKLEWKELASVDALRKIAGIVPPLTIDERRIELERILLDAGLPSGMPSTATEPERLKAARMALRECTYVALVRRAGELDNGGAVVTEATWRMCSGLAHGDRSATLGLLGQEVIEEHDFGLSLMRTASPVQLILTSTMLAISLARAAFDRYETMIHTPY